MTTTTTPRPVSGPARTLAPIPVFGPVRDPQDLHVALCRTGHGLPWVAFTRNPDGSFTNSIATLADDLDDSLAWCRSHGYHVHGAA